MYVRPYKPVQSGIQNTTMSVRPYEHCRAVDKAQQCLEGLIYRTEGYIEHLV